MNDAKRAELIEMVSKQSVVVYKALEKMHSQVQMQTLMCGDATAYDRLHAFQERLKEQQQNFTLLYGEAMEVVNKLAKEQG